MTRSDAYRVAVVLAARLRGIHALQARGISHVSLGTAAKVLGVSAARVGQLVKAGRLDVYAFPGGSRQDRYVAVADLAAAPTPLEAGHAVDWNIAERFKARAAEAAAEPAAPVEKLTNKENHGVKRPANYGRWGGRNLKRGK